ncbi:acyl carrier protein [Prosthecobacter fluviatilis]|uniref:Acyl carrier protein n=1 Tax=Prosthecobacter fluviatilis TaxID=445931 RepID=A0ABW0KKD8_9BACT
MTLEKIFTEVFAIPESTVTDTLELRQINTWDSMTHMLLITRIEEVFSVQLTGDEIADMKSVGDARRALQAHAVAV